jgi:16S rRNA (guanine(527)-N(7))-methyltransferase RsmG
MERSPEKMQEIFMRSEIDLTEGELDLFYRFYLQLIEKAPTIDLTSLVSLEDIVIKHFIDSLIVSKLIDIPTPLIDIGTGAGFPAIPLKIVCPELEIYAAENRKERVGFLLETIELLGLEGIEIYPLKVKGDLPFIVRGAITRALEPINETLIRTAHFLRKGQEVIFMKGPSADSEIEQIDDRTNHLFSLKDNISYKIPGTTFDRKLIVFERLEQRMEHRDNRHDTFFRERQSMKVEIKSGKNPHFKVFKSLLTGRGLKKGGVTILSGEKQVRETLDLFSEEVEGIITAPGIDLDVSLNNDMNIAKYHLSKSLFNEIDTSGTNSPLLIIKIREIPQWSNEDVSEWPAGITIFVPFQDPTNIGAMVRTAVAFGVKRIVLLDGAANPYHVKSIRVAGTSIFRAPFFWGPKIDDLAVGGAPLFSLDANGENIAKAVLPFNMGLVVGLEGPGLPKNIRQLGEKRSLSIPMVKGIESINATSALVSALFEWRRRHFTR